MPEADPSGIGVYRVSIQMFEVFILLSVQRPAVCWRANLLPPASKQTNRADLER